MTQLIAIAAQKGGVGKTATTINLGYELSQAGKKTLLVDFDPQANTTTGLGIDPRSLSQTIYEAMKQPEIANNCLTTINPNLELLPANLDLAGAEIELSNQQFYDRNGWLSDALKQIKNQYDYVLIDCPPSLGFYTANALYAANLVLIPLQCEYYAYDSIEKLLQVIQLVRRRKQLEIAGIILTMYDRRVGLTSDIEQIARDTYSELVFETVIPRNIKIAEASIEGVPVANYNRYGAGAQAYNELAIEFLKRIEG